MAFLELMEGPCGSGLVAMVFLLIPRINLLFYVFDHGQELRIEGAGI